MWKTNGKVGIKEEKEKILKSVVERIGKVRRVNS